MGDVRASQRVQRSFHSLWTHPWSAGDLADEKAGQSVCRRPGEGSPEFSDYDDDWFRCRGASLHYRDRLPAAAGGLVVRHYFYDRRGGQSERRRDLSLSGDAAIGEVSSGGRVAAEAAIQ